MSNFKIALAGALLGSLLAAAGADAQQGPPVPVEIIACNFLEGRGIDDLQSVNDQFNAWADREGITNMLVSMTTPMFVSPDDDSDVYYLNAWADGAAMGAGYTALYSGSFDRVAADFEEIVECESHAYFGGIVIIPATEERDGGPIQFQDCTLRENLTTADAIQAITSFADNAGPRLGGFGLLFPFAGQPREAAYSFKLVAFFNSFQSMGDAFDAMFRGGGGAAAGAMNDVMSCDRPRIYSQVTIRDSEDF